ncbi:MAG TPA: alpha/beta hydrolase-fold protein [Thermoanaerobaculia bacterium]|jgi:predicted alpha/beta superfamily hydrolase|nr:alpha/beta hydrolase-fold protein [Thermoanaerobaculia bacterium]
MPSGRIESWGSYDFPGIGARRVRVYVPRGRAERSVVVLFDGQNVFGDEGSFTGGWHAHRAAERVVTRKRAAPIVVAVDHGYGARGRELLPFAGGRSRGDLDAMVAFLRGRLAHDVRVRFGIADAPARWIVGGASLGGVAALYTHFAAPEVFGGALCMSPSFGIVGRRLYEWIAAQPLPWTSRIYLDCGVREGRGATLPRVEAMAGLLRARGYGEDRLRFRRDARGRHDEISWRRRLPGALRFLLR